MDDKKKAVAMLEKMGLDVSHIEGNNERIVVATSDKEFIIRKNPFVQLKDIFVYNSCNIDQQKFLDVIRKLDENMFKAVEKIIFINSKDEYCKFIEEYQNDSMDINEELGKMLYFENIVLINMYAINRYCNKRYSGYELERMRNIGVYTTLLHELKHLMQTHPLFYEKDYSDKEAEDDAEWFARDNFYNIIDEEDYFVLSPAG